MSNTPAVSIYESAFTPSDKTDAILLVDGNKLHVNKGLLSYHSDYFKALFNSDFAEKSMPEIPIKDVKFQDFATLLSLVHENTILPTEANAKKLLKLADRFLIHSAKRHVKLYMGFSYMDRMKKLIFADKYNLKALIDRAVALFTEKQKMSNIPAVSIYESTFAPSDKTDAILIVDGKKLHVNKGLLSYHSDYFKTLFNSVFAEKSMPEIPIKDVNFNEFATLLSLVHENPIVPTQKNAEILLELADRFLIHSAKRHVELFICTTKMNRFKKLELADKYNLEILLEKSVSMFEEKKDFNRMYDLTLKLTDHTRSKLFQRFFYLCKTNSTFDLVLG